MPDRLSLSGHPASSEPDLVDMQTRFVAVKKNPIETLLPYILSAIETIGCGSAVVVQGGAGSDSGLQLTAPPKVMEFLVETIATYEGTSPTHPAPVMLGDFPLNMIYSPIVKVGSRADIFKAAVENLGIYPPDMRTTLITLDAAGNSALIVSGPELRKVFYTNSVLPLLQKLAAELP